MRLACKCQEVFSRYGKVPYWRDLFISGSVSSVLRTLVNLADISSIPGEVLGFKEWLSKLIC